MNKISLWHAYHERRHTALSSYSQKTPSLSQGAALVQIIVSMIRERMNVGGEGRERGRERERETFPYEMVLEEVSLCIQASVLESHCGKV